MSIRRQLQRRAVDAIKRHALELSLASPRAQAQILTEYLWIEEGTEAAAVHRAKSTPTPEWVQKLAANQLADEDRHAKLLRSRLVDLGARTDREPPSLVRAKLWWLERVTASYMTAFAAGPIVVVLVIAAQLEATGVRMFSRHLDVLESHAPHDPTTAMIRTIVADEKRHAKSCAAAAERLVRDDERELFEALRGKVEDIDRAFGVTISLAFWTSIAMNVARDRFGDVRAVARGARERHTIAANEYAQAGAA